MPAFPIRQDPDKIFLVDKAPVYTGMLCEIFRRQSDVRRSIHLSSSVCAVGPNADYLVRDHHFTDMPWGKNSPFLRLTELDARILGLGAGFEYMTPLHAVECLLYDEVPYFRRVFDGTIKYRWRRANGETGEHEYRRRTGDIRPLRVKRALFCPRHMRRRENIQFEGPGHGRKALHRARHSARSQGHNDVY